MTATTRLLALAGLSLVLTPLAQASDDAGVIAADLLADASARPAIAPDAQAFSVDVHGYLMFRYDFNHRGDSDLDANGNKNTVGFQDAYSKLQIGGHIFSEAWTYGIQFKFTENDGTVLLDDAWGSYKFDGNWTLKWGQFKMPLLREELISDTYQLAANRSVMNSVFTQSRSQGVQFGNQWDQFRFNAAFNDGLNTKNTDFTAATEADYAFTGRAEWKWAGDWKQATDFTSFKNSQYFGMLGGAAHYQSGGDTFATADVRVFEATLDVSVEGNGWNAYAAGVYRNTDPSSGSSLDDLGFLVQGGFFVTAQCEIFGRYDVVIPDNGHTGTDDNFNTITIGVNHYFIPESHAAKFTFDAEFFLNKQDQSIAPASTLTGLLASDKDSQWNLRAQMQLIF